MCGRFSLFSAQAEQAEAYRVDKNLASYFEPNYNLKPTDQVPVVIESLKTGELERILALASWSLIPGWVKDGKPKFSTFNARSEEAAIKPSWREAVKTSRCLIPANGYFEWREKKPHYVSIPGKLLSFAGLYSWWRPEPTAEWQLTATILTMPATSSTAELHDRTPVILPADKWREWLNPAVQGDQTLVDEAVASAFTEAEKLEFYEVAPLRGNDSSLLNPIT